MKRPAAAEALSSRPKRQKRQVPDKLPVSAICGFLGAGKTTLLKHILESKQADAEDGFRCAVIVNDMAKLNIDKSLIDQSALIQSDDVIAMQNGCVCCTLQNDLVSQIKSLAKKKAFHYMFIEASGVSEPSQIAKLFLDGEECGKPDNKNKLNQLARLDTCATVVDSAEFFTNFETIKQGPKDESYPQLLVEQVEYANVVILNKTDLVSTAQLSKVRDQIEILNSRAKVLTACNSKIDVAEVVDSGLYNAADFSSLHPPLAEQEDEVLKDCCKDAMLTGGMPCCGSTRTRNSGVSKICLGYSGPKLVKATGETQKPRHDSRFGITSFIYQARRPFHPERFDQNFIEKFFVVQNRGSSGEEEKGKGRKGKKASKQELAKMEKQRDAAARKQQRVAKEKRKLRTEQFGDLLRSKGFLWLPNRHDFMGVLSQASDVMTIEFANRWNALQPNTWEGPEEEKAAMRKDFMEPWGDRRQDLVFIGKDLKEGALHELLDTCLLTDEEMAMGQDGWKALFGDVLLDNCASDSDDEE